MAEDGASSRRVELVAAGSPDRAEAGRTGLGMVIGLVVGWSSLVGAASGTERFEIAIAHFVGVVLVSVAGVLLLGTLWDNVRRAAQAEASAEDTSTAQASQESNVGDDAPELTLGTSS